MNYKNIKIRTVLNIVLALVVLPITWLSYDIGYEKGLHQRQPIFYITDFPTITVPADSIKAEAEIDLSPLYEYAAALKRLDSVLVNLINDK